MTAETQSRPELVKKGFKMKARHNLTSEQRHSLTDDLLGLLELIEEGLCPVEMLEAYISLVNQGASEAPVVWVPDADTKVLASELKRLSGTVKSRIPQGPNDYHIMISSNHTNTPQRSNVPPPPESGRLLIAPPSASLGLKRW